MQENIELKTAHRGSSEEMNSQQTSASTSSDALQAKMENSGNPFKSDLPGSMAAPPFQFKSEMPVQRQSEEEESLSA